MLVEKPVHINDNIMNQFEYSHTFDWFTYKTKGLY